MHIDGERKTGLDFMADLFSGRVHNTLLTLTRRLEVQSALNALQEIHMTQNEQDIMNAASVITSSVQVMSNRFEALKARIATLQEQAASPQAHDVEDLSQEFQALNASLENLNTFSASLSEAVSTGTTDAPPVGTEVDPSTPATLPVTDPEPPGATVAPIETVPAEIPETPVTPEATATPVAEETESLSDPTDEAIDEHVPPTDPQEATPGEDGTGNLANSPDATPGVVPTGNPDGGPTDPAAPIVAEPDTSGGTA